MPHLEGSAVLFDLDGVLVDSTESVTRVWRGWAIEHGYDPEVVVKIAHGRRAIETVQLVAPHLDSVTELIEIERRELADTEGLRKFAGADELLGSLPHDRWTVVTSGTRALATMRLQAAGLPVPETMISADDVALGKPNPAPYLKGAEMLGVAPDNCMVIEDAPSGLRAAKAAGMRAFGVPTTYERHELHEATVLLDTLEQLRAETLHKNGSRLIRLTWTAY